MIGLRDDRSFLFLPGPTTEKVLFYATDIPDVVLVFGPWHAIGILPSAFGHLDMTHDFSIAPRCLELEGMQATSGNEHPSEDTLCLSYVLSSFHFPYLSTCISRQDALQFIKLDEGGETQRTWTLPHHPRPKRTGACRTGITTLPKFRPKTTWASTWGYPPTERIPGGARTTPSIPR